MIVPHFVEARRSGEHFSGILCEVPFDFYWKVSLKHYIVGFLQEKIVFFLFGHFQMNFN